MPKHILAIDTSITSPGFAVIKISDKGVVKVVFVGHTKTKSDQSPAVRMALIYAYTVFTLNKYGHKVDAITRESYFAGRGAGDGHKMMYYAWAAVEQALTVYGLKVTDKEVSPTTVKRLVGGGGKAGKDDVAEGVRKITGYDGDFATSDESDAVGIALVTAHKRGWITLE